MEGMDQGGMSMPGMVNMPITSPAPSSSSTTTDPVGHGHGGGGMKMMMMHMSFYWGKDAVILFDNWPGTNPYKYTLALIAVFLVCFLVEWLSRCRLVASGTYNEVVSGLIRMMMHAVRMTLAYVAMLAVMSFNVGVLIAAVAGHAIGFLIFGTEVFSGRRKGDQDRGNGTTSCGDRDRSGGDKKPDLPPMSC